MYVAMPFFDASGRLRGYLGADTVGMHDNIAPDLSRDWCWQYMHRVAEVLGQATKLGKAPPDYLESEGPKFFARRAIECVLGRSEQEPAKAPGTPTWILDDEQAPVEEQLWTVVKDFNPIEAQTLGNDSIDSRFTLAGDLCKIVKYSALQREGVLQILVLQWVVICIWIRELGKGPASYIHFTWELGPCLSTPRHCLPDR